MRATETRSADGPNAMANWWRIRNPLRVSLNLLVVKICSLLPSLRAKRWLLRRLGVEIGEGASLAPGVTIDFFFPGLVRIEDGATVGYDALLLTHEFLEETWKKGGITVGEGAVVGAKAVVLPGVEIGEGAVVAAGSVVTRDVPPGATVGGVPAEKIGEEERAERYMEP